MANHSRFSNIVSALYEAQNALRSCSMYIGNNDRLKNSVLNRDVTDALKLLDLILDGYTIPKPEITIQDLKHPIGAEIVDVLKMAAETATWLQSKSAPYSFEGQLAKNTGNAISKLLPVKQEVLTASDYVYNKNSNYKGD